ncbi:SprT family protein [Gorillibacterium timonense]|uniref:SprT family protein n=1 Tax=Gorillibacterium timonense TaxID=1689269 RepID=UPI00071C59E5|nr:SprT family protein [Gorillibacterium timonense]
MGETNGTALTDELLQQRVEEISLTFFGKPFRHRAKFNSRLRSTGGRYFTKSHNIEISSRHAEEFGLDEMDKIIKHELCHYHLHLSKRGYQHRDADFKALLRQVGGTRFCRSLPTAGRKEPYRYRLRCQACGMEYLRKRRVDPTRYLCGRCRGKLKLEALDLSRMP